MRKHKKNQIKISANKKIAVSVFIYLKVSYKYLIVVFFCVSQNLTMEK